MRNYVWGFAALTLCAALAGCSGDSKKTSRSSIDSAGLAARPVMCSSDPRRYALASRIDDIDDGGGCRVENAYHVNAVSGVELNQTSTFNCETVEATSLWLQRIVQPAAEEAFGERVARIEVLSSYACRTRNSLRGAKLSEHARGNAIDVSAFILESGRRVTVLNDWNGSRDEERFLRDVRQEACGLFKTVLGPGSDRYHRDHFHFDLQRHRSGGAYCK
jgi:hypothetical protein